MLEKLKRYIQKLLGKEKIFDPLGPLGAKADAALEAKGEYINRFNLKPMLLDNLLSLMEEDIERGIDRKQILCKYFWH